METKSINMDGPTAKELYKTASPAWKKALEDSFGKEFFSENICDRISSFEDVLNLIGKAYDEVVPWKKPKNAAQKRCNARAMQDAISEAYLEGEVLDFTNSATQKHFIWMEKKARGGWVLDYFYYSCVCAYPGVVYFKKREHAEDAWKKFPSPFIDSCPE